MNENRIAIPVCDGSGCLSKLNGNDLADLIINAEKEETASMIEWRPYDAALVEIEADKRARILFSTDFGAPVGDDAFRAGRIAALNAFSDIYASGAYPKYANVILAVDASYSAAQNQGIVDGLYCASRAAGARIAGGHTIISDRPLIGLSVIGVSEHEAPASVCRAGDAIMVNKPLGLGMGIRAAFSDHLFTADETAELYDHLLEPNRAGPELYGYANAMTDVTGFGLVGHLSEIIGSGMGATIELGAVPLLSPLKRLSPYAFLSDFIENNISYAKRRHAVNCEIDTIQALSVFDPQVNGALLAVADPGEIALFESRGFGKIGEITNGAVIDVRA